MPMRYLELFGVRRFVRLEDYLTPELEDEARREGEALLEGVREPDDLRRLTFRGVDVGRQALSTVSRYLHEGGVDLADAEARGRAGPPAAVGGAVDARLRTAARRRGTGARPLQRAQLRRPGAAQRPRPRPRAERRPVRRRLRGRHARAQALHRRDEGDPPALARRRVMGARARAALGRAAGARARARLLEALRRDARTTPA